MKNTIKLTGDPSSTMGKKQMALLSKAVTELHMTGVKIEVTGFHCDPKKK